MWLQNVVTQPAVFRTLQPDTFYEDPRFAEHARVRFEPHRAAGWPLELGVMVKISASTTFYKKVFPIIWVGFLVVFAATGLSRGEFHGDNWWGLVMVIIMAAFGFFLMKRLVWDLVDEVHDGGNFLLIRKGGDEERVPLSNIMNVNASTNMNPPRVTLRLVKAGRFGSEVSFALRARFSFNPFAKHPVVEDLIVRVDKARRSA